MIDHEEVRLTLRSRLLEVAGVNPRYVEWENRHFTPPSGKVWVRETLIPNLERQVATDLLEAIGLVQYSVFGAAGGGTDVVGALARSIGDAFKPGSSIVGATTVNVRRSEVLPGGVTKDRAYFMVPVRISWRAYAPRPTTQE